MILFLVNVFSILIVRFFDKNSEKIKSGKTRNYDGEKEYFEKKALSSFFKASFYQFGRAEHMPMVAGRLVYFSKWRDVVSEPQWLGEVFS